ncbi:hypothetical protein N5D01_16555 [Acinetobacter johnsonii]|uniref:hypothetical protein n=1 Tax=Acinetobacter johnsonii TaxID=40214 RepID=UPI002447030B|nr:hypothetical protein [Acinetobacter johnsonii]MDH0836924.1 hypothetical protein [Acinetobacter johnsonii]MDH0840359.1 hypothetical protein [Acinetobacter johnsonii]
MSDLKMNKEDGVESYEFATPEAIEEALKIGKLSQTVFGMGCFIFESYDVKVGEVFERHTKPEVKL